MTLTLQEIDAIHGDGVLPQIMCKTSFGEGVRGYLRIWTDTPMVDPEIYISERGTWPSLTAAHELGHAVEILGTGQGTSVVEEDARFEGWRSAIRNSAPFQKLMFLRGGRGIHRFTFEGEGYGLDVSKLQRELVYMMKWEEFWARSYAQFIATRSNSDIFKKELEMARSGPMGYMVPGQWDDNEFKAIEVEIEKLFKVLGWMV